MSYSCFARLVNVNGRLKMQSLRPLRSLSVKKVKRGKTPPSAQQKGKELKIVVDSNRGVYVT